MSGPKTLQTSEVSAAWALLSGQSETVSSGVAPRPRFLAALLAFLHLPVLRRLSFAKTKNAFEMIGMRRGL
jgi:hypothetical protein